MPLEVQFPSRSPARKGGFPTRRRGIARWLRELDKLDRREHSRRLIEGVRQLNRLEIPPRRRLALLEDMRPAVRTALDYLASRVQSQTLPLSQRAREAHERNVELLCESGLGYVIVVVDEGSGGRRRRVALAAERALERSGEWMLRCAQLYTAAPSTFWHTVHTCYATAERNRIATRRVAAPEAATQSGHQSPAAMYKRILLFALAGTQGMRRGEAARIYRALATWGQDATLGREDEVADAIRFALDLEAAQPPVPQAQVRLDEASRLRIIGVDGVVERVQRLQGETSADDSPVAQGDRIAPGSLRRLIDSWHPLTHERSERTRRGEEVDAEITLAVIHARLAAERDPQRRQARGAGRRTQSAAALTLQTIEEAAPPAAATAGDAAGAGWHEIGRGQERSRGYDAARRVEAGLDHEGTLPQHPRWLLEDVSASGYRLVWDSQEGSRAAVGELVALRLSAEQAASGQRWSVGVVRRMQFVDDTRFEIGVHALSRNAVPARVRREPANPNRKRDRDREPTEAALVMPARDRGAAAPSLLLPAHMFRCGETLELDLPQRRARIRLRAVRENTGAFCEFTLEPPPARGRHAVQPGGGPVRGGDAPDPLA